MGAKAAEKLVERLLAALEDAPAEKAVDLLAGLARETERPAHADLLRTLTHLEASEEEARGLIAGALRHRDLLAERLGRAVGARVALFDYLVSVERRLANPKVVEMSTWERIERSAVTDHLTGAFNRLYFDARLGREIRRARRFGQHLSLLLLDLDDFKSVNDQRGHQAGDAVLKEVGRLIVGRIRDIDICARYGGEEFAVILPETPRNGAFVVAERVRREVERHFRRRGISDRALRITISGGLACYPDDAADAEALISKADQALYRAKRSGKNVIEVYYHEKRRSERVDLEENRVRAVVQLPARGGRVRRSGVVKNLSEGGALVELSAPVPVGCDLKISFSLGAHQDYTLDSKVVRIEEHGANGRRRRFEAGLQFQRRARDLQPQLHRLARRQQAAAG
jgi:diguanylate cyclase (GGDEF)-like protein